MRVYQNKTVYDAVQERLDFIFNEFETIGVSVSGGKDSTLLFDLVYKKAIELDRKLIVFFLDQEAEYQSTIDIVSEIMTRKNVIPHWYQVPIHMTNATSYNDEMLYAWEPGKKWMREKSEIAIKEIKEDYPDRFYKFMLWFEKTMFEKYKNICFLVGLRAEESLNRYRAVIKNPGYKNIFWSTKSNGLIKFYPLYDWSFDDIFYYFYWNKVKYNRIYDFLHIKDKSEQITKMRVSNLIHEKAYRSLSTIQEFEHGTYEKLIKRLDGISVAARYSDKSIIFSVNKLPDKFKTWLEYRDHLLETTPLKRKEKFINRFDKQEKNERVYRQQVKQILLNDWENNLPVNNKTDYEDKLRKWRDIL